MATKLGLLLGFFLCLSVSLVVADWNILNYRVKKRSAGMSLKNYCESWRINVELNNIKEFDVVPGECVDYIGKYMTSAQYKSDVQRAVEESNLYLSNNFALGGDGKDAWIFDIDDTLLSTLPYYKQHNYGGEKINRTALERWMGKSKAPALDHALCLYNKIKGMGLKVLLISSRGEHLREATVNNLVKVGFHGWTELILRYEEDGHKSVEKYKSDQRRRMVESGYRLWGIVGDQWSGLLGSHSARRTFKLPNSLYYDF